MNILSLFDGISCGRVALERAGIQVDKYFASEVDRYAIQIAKKNYPDTIPIGSVTDVRYEKDEGRLYWHQEHSILDNIDMIIGGSPCQDLSIAKKDGKGLQGEKSGLFFEYVRLLKEVKPKYFLLENVASMKKADKEEITRILTEIYPDVQCYLINSALVSAQNRKRLYWTNIQGVEQPEDKGILLKDILEENVDEKYEVQGVAMRNRGEGKRPEFNKVAKANSMTTVQTDSMVSIRVGQFNSGGQGDRVYSPEGKSVSLSANGGGRGAKTGLYLLGNTNPSGRGMNGTVHSDIGKSPTVSTNKGEGRKIESQGVIRKLTPIECERLQTLPDNYTEGVSNTQRYKMIGNGWTVDVIAHIFFYIK